MKRILKIWIGISLFLVISIPFYHTILVDVAFSDAIVSWPNYQMLSELKGQTFNIETMEIPQKEALALIANPLSFTFISPVAGEVGIVSHKHDFFMFYLDPMQEDRLQRIKRVDLPDILSNRIRISYTPTILDDRLIVFDDKKNMLIVMDWNDNYKNNKIEIKNAIRFTSKYASVADLKAICGYTAKNKIESVLAKNDEVYVIEIGAMKLLQTKRFPHWKTISGYFHSKHDQEKDKKDTVYLYQVGNNLLRKYNFTDDQVVYELDLNHTPVKGEIVDIATDEKNLIYILTRDHDKSVLYKTNERTFGWFKYTNTFDDNTPFGEIKNVCYFSTSGAGKWLGLFQTDSQPPVRVIDAIGYRYTWKETGPADSSDGAEEPMMTREFGDTVNWNHPVKEIFKKYGLTVTRVEFTQHNTYYTFYVEEDDDITGYKMNDKQFLEALADKNNYWDFKISISQPIPRAIRSYEVACDKKQKKIIGVNMALAFPPVNYSMPPLSMPPSKKEWNFRVPYIRRIR